MRTRNLRDHGICVAVYPERVFYVALNKPFFHRAASRKIPKWLPVMWFPAITGQVNVDGHARQPGIRADAVTTCTTRAYGRAAGRSSGQRQ
jgi:hypothetical protein